MECSVAEPIVPSGAGRVRLSPFSLLALAELVDSKIRESPEEFSGSRCERRIASAVYTVHTYSARRPVKIGRSGEPVGEHWCGRTGWKPLTRGGKTKEDGREYLHRVETGKGLEIGSGGWRRRGSGGGRVRSGLSIVSSPAGVYHHRARDVIAHARGKRVCVSCGGSDIPEADRGEEAEKEAAGGWGVPLLYRVRTGVGAKKEEPGAGDIRRKYATTPRRRVG